MGSEVRLVVAGGGDVLCEFAGHRIRELEGRWSRFIPTSDVTRVNLAGGRPVGVHPDTVALFATAIEARKITGGRTDPTVLGAVVAAGYSHSRRGPASPGFQQTTSPGGGAAIDVHPGSVRIEPGAGFDPGSIGKGLAADLVAAELIDAGAVGALVSIGGDMSVRGNLADGSAWQVVVEDPWDPTIELARLRLGAGGVATSSIVSGALAEAAHHVIDPATSHPCRSDAAAVTVVAGTAWLAEALATAVLVAGTDEGVALLEEHRADGLVVGHDGSLRITAGLGTFL